MNRSDVRDICCGVLLIISFVWFAGLLVTGVDQHTEDELPNGCLLKVHKVNNAWFTPGSESESRKIYCPAVIDIRQ